MSPLNKTIRRNWRDIFIAAALLADTLAIAISIFAAHYFRLVLLSLDPFEMEDVEWIALFFWSVPIFYGLVLGLYRSAYQTKKSYQHLLAGKVYFLSAITIFTYHYIFKVEAFRAITVFYLMVLPFVFALGRLVLNWFDVFMRRHGFGIFNAIIIGNETAVLDAYGYLSSYPELGYMIKGVVIDDPQIEGTNLKWTMPSVKEFRQDELPNMIEQEQIDKIFIPSITNSVNNQGKILKLCKEKGVELKLLSSESLDVLRHSKVCDIVGISLYALPRPGIDAVKRILKRIFDFAAASVLMLVLSPLFFIIVIAILIEDGYPVFFSQKRALIDGERGFNLLKFRSMTKDAESRQKELYELNQRTGGLFLLEEDPRLTKVGKFLRSHSLDELPQMISVLNGEMSLVGPRPLSLEDLKTISPENQLGGYYIRRAKAKPGMTGLWQISGRREVEFKDMIMLDLYYIENQSPVFDLEILFATIPVVLFGRGAY